MISVFLQLFRMEAYLFEHVTANDQLGSKSLNKSTSVSPLD